MKCQKCKQFKLFDNMFGFCKKYKEQALLTENCKIITSKMVKKE